MYVPLVVNVTMQLSLPVAATNPSQKRRSHDATIAPPRQLRRGRRKRLT